MTPLDRANASALAVVSFSSSPSSAIRPCSCLYQLASSGVSVFQGSHQEAQKFTMTGLSRYWLSETWPDAPSAATVNPGAAGAGGAAAEDEVARLTAMIAAANTAMLPVTTLCRPASRAVRRAALGTLIA